MSIYNHIRLLRAGILFSSTFILLTICSSFSNRYSKNQYSENKIRTSFSHTIFNLNSTFFPVVFTGNGIDHMNINLVDLRHTGLKSGDEIGVFDGIYCVGATILTDLDIAQNTLSIPASTNDTIENNPNGFIPGHIVTLKLYRHGVVYPLQFQPVNNSKPIFESKGTLFALVDFLNSLALKFSLQTKNIKIYPSRFKETLYILINTDIPRNINCEIYDSDGKLVKSVINDRLVGEKIIVWDGKNNNNQKLNPGNYYLRTNNLIKKIVLSK